MRYIEIYNINNILEYRIEIDRYQVGDLGMNFFTNFEIDFDLFFKNPKDCIDEMNNKISYDLNCCRPEEYFKVKLIDEEADLMLTCDKVILGMLQESTIFFAPNIETMDGETKVRYYITFCSAIKVEYIL